MSLQSEPRVSVITPFYNTAEYLAEAIESVLSQSYSNYEYLLVNNKSTDGCRDIALRYAAKDRRIRVIDNPAFVSQIQNYNGALEQIDSQSKYVKFAQADDMIYPECIARMVELAEREPTVGIVSSYYLFGDYLDGAGIDYRVSLVQGREACRQMLLQGRSFVGSPTTILYRANIVRARQPFFREIPYMADADVAFEILRDHDLGYVHQILSLTRVENESVMSAVRNFEPMTVFFHAVAEFFGPDFLAPDELTRVRQHFKHEYYKYIGKNWWRGERFWKFQRDVLGSFHVEVASSRAVAAVVRDLARVAANPGSALAQAWRNRQIAR